MMNIVSRGQVEMLDILIEWIYFDKQDGKPYLKKDTPKEIIDMYNYYKKQYLKQMIFEY